MDINFTRYLYLYDEVELSLIISLLHKRNLKKVLFWCYELYYSSENNDIFHFLIKVYFDFYALNNPKFYDYIVKNYKKWKSKKDIYIVGNICKNLFGFKFNLNVFLIRQISNNVTKKDITAYKGRKPQWCKQFDSKFSNLYIALNKKDYKNVCYYLKMLDCTSSEKFLGLINYFEKIEGATIIHENVKSELPEYSDFEHYIYYALVLMFNHEYNENIKKIYSTLNNDEKDNIVNINKKDDVQPKYKTLRYKRLFKIAKGIGCFNLTRGNNIKNKMNYHWLYYASDNYYWKNILDKYKYKKDHIKKEIKFETDDMLEEFSENHGFLEPDEQSLETQEKSTCDINLISWKKFAEYFSNDNDYIYHDSYFNDDFKFCY